MLIINRISFFDFLFVFNQYKSCGDKINTNFQSKKIPKRNTLCKCLPLIMLDSVIRVGEKNISKHFWKNVHIKQKRIKWRILLMMI